MASLIQQWLAQQLANIDSVQRCVLGTNGEIVVHSWRGVQIHVHTVEAPLKTRSLKKTVQEATRVGVGSLFIVNAALLPPDGARLVPDEWLLAIHALTDDKIYAYRVKDDKPSIFQVHFRPTTKIDERDIWYGPDVQLGKLPFYRVWVKTPSVKGDFLIANFASDPFWHNREYRNARAAAAEQKRRAERGNGSAHFEYGYGGFRGPDELLQRQPTLLERSYETLGLRPGVPCDEVKSAYRKLARETHPDVSSLPKQEAETRFRALHEAYNYIRDNGGCEERRGI